MPYGRRQAASLADLGLTFARLRRSCAQQGRYARQLAAEADTVAATRTKPRTRPGGRHKAVLNAIREEVGYHAAWARWSASVDELAALADEIARRPARNLDDVAVKFEAVEWALLDGGVLLDDAIRRQVKAFARELRGLSAARR